jgi:hypothetical protein
MDVQIGRAQALQVGEDLAQEHHHLRRPQRALRPLGTSRRRCRRRGSGPAMLCVMAFLGASRSIPAPTYYDEAIRDDV